MFNQTLMNIFSNYISNELKTVDGNDPSWMNESFKKKIIVKIVHVSLLKLTVRTMMPT